MSSKFSPEEAPGLEHAEVEDNDVESIICVCGNNTSDEGMIQADSDGIAIHIDNTTPVPAGMSEWPQDEDELHTLCPSCGRVYHDKTIKETGRAPVAFQVDPRHGAVDASIRAHYKALD